MTIEEIIEQLENAIELIKQDGKDWLDDRDIPILEACIKSLTALDKIRAEIEQLPATECTETCLVYINPDDFKENVLAILDKYKVESEE